jgi:hypothetical protein
LYVGSSEGNTLTETNRWEHYLLTEWLALPKEPEIISLQVATHKLKFSFVKRTQLLRALLYGPDKAGAVVDSGVCLFVNDRSVKVRERGPV